MPKIAKEMGALEVSRLRDKGEYAVGGVSGLYLRVDGAARYWIFRYRSGAGRHKLGVGAYPAITLAMARDIAREHRLTLAGGTNPLSDRVIRRQQQALQDSKRLLFKDAVKQCIKDKAKEWSNPKHAAQWTSTLETYANPKIGELDVTSIDTQHILQVLRPIWESKTETASRVRGRVETVLDWSFVNISHKGQNPARWAGHLDQILAKPKKISQVEHHEAVPFKSVNEVFRKITAAQGMGARALLFQILTAARSGEVRGAKWDEFDLDGGVWTLPAARMKARREHRVPLSRQAIALIKTQSKMENCDLVFPGLKNKALSDMSLTAVMRRLGFTAVPHGFRSTFRDWAAECTEFPNEVVEMALAHAIENKSEAAYRRGDMLQRRIPLMQDWADYCAKT